MQGSDILIQVISNIIECGKTAGLGRHAISIANGVDGLAVNSGGVVITGNALQILDDLVREYEVAMKAKLSVKVKASLHIAKYAYAAPKSGFR